MSLGDGVMKTNFALADDLTLASEIIRGGGLVAVPTETVYGLASNGLDAEAVKHIYEVKGRPEQKPLPLMVAGDDAMEQCWTSVPPGTKLLAEKYWPGPLTMVMTAKPEIPEIIRAGGDTVALRCPDHPLTLELIKKSGTYLAAPSANPSGGESPKNAEDVIRYFDGLIDGVIDGGECGIGVESTIVDLSVSPFKILREGAIPASELERTLSDSLTLIGITGGTGCGKTTALNVLTDMGALVIDCDEVYHELTENSAEMKTELIERFGDVYNGNVLDRKALGNVVFSDADALLDLNAITHKYVNGEVEHRLANWAMLGGKVAAIDAIALLEGQLAPRCKYIVGIIAPTEARVARLMARENIAEEYARMRISAQKSNEYFKENCSHILSNDSSIEDFHKKCEILFSNLIKEND